MLYECPEDKPVPKDLKPAGDAAAMATIKAAEATKNLESLAKAYKDVCCPASMVGFAVFSLLL
jgi:hypothetical protein